MTPAASGLVIVDKPAGLTSHDVVGRIRRLAGTRRVGHAGTLDPMATGVLVIGVERATRLLTYLVGAEKAYTATIRLGVSTTTDDADGEVLQRVGAAGMDAMSIGREVTALTGDLQQVPSAVSAIKVEGRRAYARVRAGEDVQLPARPVWVHRFEVLAVRAERALPDEPDQPELPVLDVDVDVTVSSGTYVRALARDLGAALGCGGHLTALRRTRVGPYALDAARTLDELTEAFTVLPIAVAARAAFPARDLSADEARRLAHGQRLESGGSRRSAVAAFAPDGELVALIEETGPTARPLVVFTG